MQKNTLTRLPCASFRLYTVRFLAVAALAIGWNSAIAFPTLESLENPQREAITRLCTPLQFTGGSESYRNCINSSLQNSEGYVSPLTGETQTALTGLNRFERLAIQQYCRLSAKDSSTYANCTNAQLSALLEQAQPTLSALTEHERYAAINQCFDPSGTTGGQHYRSCLNDAIDSLLSTAASHLSGQPAKTGAASARSSQKEIEAMEDRSTQIISNYEAQASQRVLNMISRQTPEDATPLAASAVEGPQISALADAEPSEVNGQSLSDTIRTGPAETSAVQTSTVQASTNQAGINNTDPEQNNPDLTALNSTELAQVDSAQNEPDQTLLTQNSSDQEQQQEQESAQAFLDLPSGTKALAILVVILPLLAFLIMHAHRKDAQSFSQQPRPYDRNSDPETRDPYQAQPVSLPQTPSLKDSPNSPPVGPYDTTIPINSLSLPDSAPRQTLATDSITAPYAHDELELARLPENQLLESLPVIDDEHNQTYLYDWNEVGHNGDQTMRDNPLSLTANIDEDIQSASYDNWLTDHPLEKRQEYAIELLIYWVAYSDNRFDPDSRRQVFQMQDPSERDLIKRSVFMKDAHTLLSALTFLQNHCSLKQHSQILDLIMGLLVAEKALSPIQNNLLRFFADAFGIGQSGLSVQFKRAYGHSMPNIPRPDKRIWWNSLDSEAIMRWDARGLSRQPAQVKHRALLGQPLSGPIDLESVRKSYSLAKDRCHLQRVDLLGEREQTLLAARERKFDLAHNSLMEYAQ